MVKGITMGVNNFFKATVRRLSELPWEELRNLFTWPSKSNLQADNPNLLIAKAVDGNGQVAAYVTAEPILLIDGYVLNPESNPQDDPRAGAAIDSALAQRAGVNRFWIVIPDQVPIMEGERFIRVFERKVAQPVTNTRRFGCCDLQQHAGFLN